jgi:hypothetical protein
MSENKWIYYEAGARAIARQRRGPDREPTATERLLARVAIDEALPFIELEQGQSQDKRPE